MCMNKSIMSAEFMPGALRSHKQRDQPTALESGTKPEYNVFN